VSTPDLLKNCHFFASMPPVFRLTILPAIHKR